MGTDARTSLSAREGWGSEYMQQSAPQGKPGRQDRMGLQPGVQRRVKSCYSKGKDIGEEETARAEAGRPSMQTRGEARACRREVTESVSCRALER